MADIIEIPMTPAQYIAARLALSAAPSVSKNTVTSTTTGDVKSAQLDFSYSYDGGSLLTMTITAKHGIKAKLADDAELKSHIMEELLELKA